MLVPEVFAQQGVVAVLVVAFDYFLSSGFAVLFPKVGILQQGCELSGEVFGIAGYGQQTVVLVVDEFGDAGDAGRDDRDLFGHGFHEHDGYPFGEACEDEDVGFVVLFADFVLPEGSGEGDFGFDAECSCVFFERGSVGSVADEGEAKGGSLFFEGCAGFEQDVLAFCGYEPADAEESGRCVAGFGARRVKVGVDAAADDVESVPDSGVAEPHDLAAAVVADAADEGGFAYFFAEYGGIDGVEDVGAVYGDAVGDGSVAFHEHADDGCGVGEVFVDVGDAVLLYPGDEHAGFDEVGCCPYRVFGTGYHEAERCCGHFEVASGVFCEAAEVRADDCCCRLAEHHEGVAGLFLFVGGHDVEPRRFADGGSVHREAALAE